MRTTSASGTRGPEEAGEGRVGDRDVEDVGRAAAMAPAFPVRGSFSQRQSSNNEE
jgi:hypothetical protein